MWAWLLLAVCGVVCVASVVAIATGTILQGLEIGLWPYLIAPAVLATIALWEWWGRR